MYPIEEFRDCTCRTADLLRRLGVRFHLTGGAASIAWGDPRMTQDIDIVLDRAQLRACLPAFFQELDGQRFLFDKSAIQQATESGRQFQLMDLDLMLKLDFYPRELVAGELDRSVEVEVFPGTLLPVVARVDAALSKLIWISKGSHKSRRDLRQVMRGASEAETRQVQEHAASLGLASLLSEVRAETDEIAD